MMGPRQVEQGMLFYNFSLDAHVPADHVLRSTRNDTTRWQANCKRRSHAKMCYEMRSAIYHSDK